MDALHEFDPLVETFERHEEIRTKSALSQRLVLLKKIGIPTGIILAGAAAVALIFAFEQAPQKKDEPFKALAVQTQTISAQTVTFSIRSQGTVVPRTETVLVTEVSGVVMNVSPKLHAGGFFKQGELLLALDPSDYEASLKLAEANLLGKKAQLTQEIAQTEQAEKEWALSGRSRQEAPVLALRQPFLEKAKAEVQFAEAELQQAIRKLERTQIRAPFDGLIKSKSVGLGRYLTVGTNLAEIVAVDYVEVRLPLSNDDLGFINLPSAREGMSFGDLDDRSVRSGPMVTLTAQVGAKSYQWPATIVRTEGVVDSRSRLHYAVAQIDDPYGLSSGSKATKPALPIGSFVRASICGVSLDGISVVPRAAFRDHDTLTVRDAEGRLRLRKASIVRADRDFVYISNGLLPGDEVITTAIVAPVDGMEVRKIAEQSGGANE